MAHRRPHEVIDQPPHWTVGRSMDDAHGGRCGTPSHVRRLSPNSSKICISETLIYTIIAPTGVSVQREQGGPVVHGGESFSATVPCPAGRLAHRHVSGATADTLDNQRQRGIMTIGRDIS